MSQLAQIQELREQSKKSLYFFAKGILRYDWLVPHIHLPVCQDLQDPTNIRKMFVLPRGWLKTTLCSISFPIWLSINNPNIRILITQNSSTNACKKLEVIRGQWEQNELLRMLFPELLPSRTSVWKADSLCLSRSASFPESTYEAAGTSTRVVSRHYDVIIEDDTVAPDFDELGDESLAPSSEEVAKAIGWHRTNALPLLNNPDRDQIVIVGTRWYDQDLIQWVKDNEPQYRITTRACKENDDGEPDAKGHITYPERFSERVLQELEAALGPYMFNCLYMNTPVRREDMAFKPEWFKYYDTHPRFDSLAVYTTVDPATDPALAKSKSTDYSVVMTCAKDLSTGSIYVLDYFRKQCNPGELASAIFDHVHRYKPIVVGYEDIAYQRSIEYWLKELMRQEGIFFVLEPLNLPKRKDAKNLRIAGLQPLFSSGSILLRPHMKELVSELLKFPLGAHDDTADALSMQMGLWRQTKLLRERRTTPAVDILSLDNAVKELTARRHHRRLSSPVYDVSSAPRIHSPLIFTPRA